MSKGAAALLTWPLEDVLHANRQSRIQPDRLTMTRLIEAIDADVPMDIIERGLSEEPILTYRFLRYTNSAGSGLDRDIDSLRQGLMVLGLGRVKTWLLEQMPRASSERNLKPVRISMVLRAQLMASMLDTAEGDALKRELYLCGLLSENSTSYWVNHFPAHCVPYRCLYASPPPCTSKVAHIGPTWTWPVPWKMQTQRQSAHCSGPITRTLKTSIWRCYARWQRCRRPPCPPSKTVLRRG